MLVADMGAFAQLQTWLARRNKEESQVIAGWIVVYITKSKAFVFSGVLCLCGEHGCGRNF